MTQNNLINIQKHVLTLSTRETSIPVWASLPGVYKYFTGFSGAGEAYKYFSGSVYKYFSGAEQVYKYFSGDAGPI